MDNLFLAAISPKQNALLAELTANKAFAIKLLQQIEQTFNIAHNRIKDEQTQTICAFYKRMPQNGYHDYGCKFTGNSEGITFELIDPYTSTEKLKSLEEIREKYATTKDREHYSFNFNKNKPIIRFTRTTCTPEIIKDIMEIINLNSYVLKY